ncbi:hypothetical protein NSB1T_11580 [Coprobacter fastidiosus NSB1 = JCM 33896]|nr:hypothetical protein NSB1T_11580 [Coprobacter fastidiosus NSB1 = JCM 33896]RHO52887.1 hypothetical protein DW107_12415 [Tannerella sp. AM09-19]RHS39414.1 hypothetical protein DWV37_16240 [Tannerella sp. AF04-6]
MKKICPRCDISFINRSDNADNYLHTFTKLDDLQNSYVRSLNHLKYLHKSCPENAGLFFYIF